MQKLYCPFPCITGWCQMWVAPSLIVGKTILSFFNSARYLLIWKLIERMMYFASYRVLHLKLSDKNWEKLCQFDKFGIVGLSNTLISYVVYVVTYHQRNYRFLNAQYLFSKKFNGIVTNKFNIGPSISWIPIISTQKINRILLSTSPVQAVIALMICYRK